IKEREQQLQQSGRRLTPIEQQFVDLAKISTAKDAIIDQQRIEMRKTNELLQKGEIESKTNQNRCEELEARLRALDDELGMLRKMGSEQEYLGDKVKELTSHLLNKEAELARTREELEARCSRLSDELREAKEKLVVIQPHFIVILRSSLEQGQKNGDASCIVNKLA
ncbi:hypothetical protein OSTOST_11151, partial [Ostertagia ostertagi]